MKLWPAPAFASAACRAPASGYDLVVFGATPAGIAAAVSAKRTNTTMRVALVAPEEHIGGMASPGGIGFRDFAAVPPCCTINEWAAYHADAYGGREDVWQPDNYIGEQSFYKLLKNASVEVFTGEELVGVKRDGLRLTEITTKCGEERTWSPSQFIDASYEGDLVRLGNVSYTFGREAEATYKEDLAGGLDFAPPFKANVSATWDNGTLLKYVSSRKPTVLGEADQGVMAFSYRLCVTQNTTNQAPFPKPAGYAPENFELMRRYMTALDKAPAFTTIFGVYPYRGYPNQKHDLCDANTFPITSDAPDLSDGYVEGIEKIRREIRSNVKEYVLGYLYWLANDPSVPGLTQNTTREWGLCEDEFTDNQNIPYQMYVREGLRLVGDHVFSEADWTKAKSSQSIGLGSWGLDIHVVHRLASEEGGKLMVRDEGYTDPGTGAHKFQLPLSLILPKKAEVTNLLVPTCLSTSHVTWAGLREEPTMWQLGMGAGTVAAMVAAARTPVQEVDIKALQDHLRHQGVPVDLPGEYPVQSLSSVVI